MRLSGKLVLVVAVGAMAVFGTAAESLADGNVSLSKPLVKPDGTAVLPAYFAVPGKAVLWDAQSLRPCGGPPRVRRVEVNVSQAGTIRFNVRPTSLIKPDLKHGRKVKVPVEVDFTPAGANVNVPEAHVRRISLRIQVGNNSAGAASATPLCGPTPPSTQSYGAGGGFRLGHPTSNPDGTATIPAHFSSRGQVHIADNQETVPCGGPPQIEDKTLKVKPGDVDLRVHPNEDLLRGLNQGGAQKVKVAVSFTPAGGTETTKRIVATFRKSDRSVAAASAAVPLC